MIFEVHTSTPATYDAGSKYSVLRETQDLRKAAVTSTSTASGSVPASSVTVVGTTTLTTTNAESSLAELDARSIGIEVTADMTMSSMRYYLANKGTLLTMTLPAVALYGTTIELKGMNAGGWKVAQTDSQQIVFGNQSTTVGASGYLASVTSTDRVRLRCTVANTVWEVDGSDGNITVA